ncbi:MAG: hypothetical protein WCI11_17730 [Candidatus Methylumidiphilus sp.]
MNIKTFSMIGPLLLAVALSGCTTPKVDKPGGVVTPPPTTTTTTNSEFAPACNRFCQHARDLKCPDGDPIKAPNGTVVTCETVCIDNQENGRRYNTQCRINATSCAVMEQCTP